MVSGYTLETGRLGIPGPSLVAPDKKSTGGHCYRGVVSKSNRGVRSRNFIGTSAGQATEQLELHFGGFRMKYFAGHFGNRQLNGEAEGTAVAKLALDPDFPMH